MPFKQDALAVASRPVEGFPDGLCKRQNLRCDIQQGGDDVTGADFGLTKTTQQGIMVDQQSIHPGPQAIGISQITDTDGAAGNLVFVGRADTASSGANPGAAECFFANPVEIAVQGQDKRRVFSDLQPVRCDLHALLADLLDLAEQCPGVDHDTITDHRNGVAAHDAGRQQAQLVGCTVDDEGMSGIMPALKAYNDVSAV